MKVPKALEGVTSSELLNLQDDLDLLSDYLNNYHKLFPYEREYLLRRVGELALQFKEDVDPDLTSAVLHFIELLNISR